MFTIKNLTVTIDQKTILNTVSLACQEGTTHVLLGPNGSGKSSLAYALMGHPAYSATGSVLIGSHDILTLSPDLRAQQGLFLAFQHPCEIPGLAIMTFLKEAYTALKKTTIAHTAFADHVYWCCEVLGIDRSLVNRTVNEGFSGGEKKRLELLQMMVLEPSVIVLDEIDSGLDIDALAMVPKAIAWLRARNPQVVVLIITHYRRMLNHLTVDTVHILYRGSLIASGDMMLIDAIEQQGYDAFAQQTAI